MAQAFSISVDLSQLLKLGPMIRDQVFENLNTAVEDVAQAGVERWQRAVLSAKLWDGERRAYAATITYRMTGPYAAEITSDYKYVEDIETGRPARDLKLMIQTSNKTRTSKRGIRYLVIPFRHNSPGNSAWAPAMPSDIYKDAKALKPSSIVGHGTRVSGNLAEAYAGGRVRTRKYVWGGRLPAGLAPKLQTYHKTDPYDSMVKMKESTGGSQYMTFRVMSERSTGWIVPAQPGQYIAQAVADSLRQTAESAFAEAVGKDVAAAA